MPTGKMTKQQAIDAAKKEAQAKAAKKSTKAPKAKKSAAKSKPKPKAKKAPNPDKALTVAQPEILDPAALALRSEEADRILHEEIPKEMAALEGGRAALHAKVQDAIEREIWRWCSTPYKSWSAYIKYMQQKSGKSITTLFNAVGLLKALPGESPESRAAIPARAGQKIKQLAKQKAKKGDKTPVSKKVVEAAKTGKPAKLDEALKAEGYQAPKTRAQKKSATADKPDPLLFNQGKSGDSLAGAHRGHAEVVNGGSGEVEGAPASAGQYSSVVEQAIEAACLLYDLKDKAAGLKRVCGEWLNNPCVSILPEFAELSNLEAFDKFRAKEV